MNVSWLLYPLLVDSIGRKTGTHRDDVKNKRLPPMNSSGALVPWSSQAWSQPDVSHPNRTWTRRSLSLAAGKCTCGSIVPQKRANKRVLYAFDQSIAWWLVGAFLSYFLLRSSFEECTRFWEKTDRAYLFLAVALYIHLNSIRIQ